MQNICSHLSAAVVLLLFSCLAFAMVNYILLWCFEWLRNGYELNYFIPVSIKKNQSAVTIISMCVYSDQ
ncbi:unnamed protein product [Rotaria magnacalcarata]